MRFEVPAIEFARRSDGLLIAYQVVGERDMDLVFLLGWPSNLALQWEHRGFARFLSRLAGFSRLILFDRPGTGLSDRGPTGQVFEDRLDDIRCVMDAVGSERTAFFGAHLGGRLALLFAATYPERTRAVVTFGAHPTTMADEDYPWGITAERLEWVLKQVGGGLNGEAAHGFFDTLTSETDPETFAWWRTYFSSAVTSKESMEELSKLEPVDIRSALGSVRVPTLIMHRTDDRAANVNASRDHLPFLGDLDTVLDLTEEFLTGARPVHAPDRVLATIMFTDIVESTRRAAELGDRRWKDALDAHDEAVRRSLDAHRGSEVVTTGDGFLATFDGPARAIRCANDIRNGTARLGLEVRIGLHTGEFEIRGDDVGGIAVHIAARVMAKAAAGEILCSRTVKDLVIGAGFVFTDRGAHRLKGVPDRWQLFAVETDVPPHPVTQRSISGG
jgi:class 3 adenylate cyclase